MQTNEVRNKYIAFFRKNAHAQISSSSIIPENDPTTLFTGSGMQPLIPYLLGEKHPQGRRLTNAQKCFRAEDINDIGDNRHTTFFEMLGNWSLGDYFKEDQLRWFFTFLTDEVGLEPKRLYVTAFSGDETNNIPKDTEAAKIWEKLFKEKGIDAKAVDLITEERGGEVGLQGGRIFYYAAKKNWWSRSGVPHTMPAGEPGGPDSEVFYEFDIPHDPKFGKECHPNCDCGRFMEIGNSVFMQYKKNTDGTFALLSQRNVDFGGGLERIVAASNNNPDVFLIDVFEGLIRDLEKLSGLSYSDARFVKSFRIVADHLRACVFIVGDGVIPSNTERGYFARRLIRRAVRHLSLLNLKEARLAAFIEPIASYYKDAYPHLVTNLPFLKETIGKEEEKFHETLKAGLREFEKLATADISGKDAFVLFSSYGFPIDMTVELAAEKGRAVDTVSFNEEFRKHQEVSRAGAEQKFKGGLADTSEKSVRYHTATHLLNAALRLVLGDHISQKGSNITAERMRFDFSHPTKLSDEEKKKVEAIVNEKIQEGLPVMCVEMPIEKAREAGAIGVFADKYGETVKVYRIGTEGAYFSQELCGGPHVQNTRELGVFTIAKEEAVSQGVRRIKAILS